VYPRAATRIEPRWSTYRVLVGDEIRRRRHRLRIALRDGDRSHRSGSRPAPVRCGHAGEEAAQLTTQHIKVGLGSTGRDGLQDHPSARVSPGQQPSPEVGPLARSADGAPGTAGQRQVEDHHRVGGFETRAKHVVGPEVAVDDPAAAPGELPLHGRPGSRCQRDEVGRPEVLVEFDHRPLCPVSSPRWADVVDLSDAPRPRTTTRSTLTSMLDRHADAPSGRLFFKL